MTCSVPQTLMSSHRPHLSKPLSPQVWKIEHHPLFVTFLGSLSIYLITSPTYFSLSTWQSPAHQLICPTQQMSSVKSHSDHVRRMYPTTPFTGYGKALEANMHCLLQKAVCFTNPLLAAFTCLSPWSTFSPTSLFLAYSLAPHFPGLFPQVLSFSAVPQKTDS